MVCCLNEAAICILNFARRKRRRCVANINIEEGRIGRERVGMGVRGGFVFLRNEPIKLEHAGLINDGDLTGSLKRESDIEPG